MKFMKKWISSFKEGFLNDFFPDMMISDIRDCEISDIGTKIRYELENFVSKYVIDRTKYKRLTLDILDGNQYKRFSFIINDNIKLDSNFPNVILNLRNKSISRPVLIHSICNNLLAFVKNDDSSELRMFEISYLNEMVHGSWSEIVMKENHDEALGE